MPDAETTPRSVAGREGATLRLLCPQWQGAGTSSVRELASEFPFDVARRGYAVGTAVLAAILPPSDGPTAAAPITRWRVIRPAVRCGQGLAMQRRQCQAARVVRRRARERTGSRPIRSRRR
jgi:hypothetical protein